MATGNVQITILDGGGAAVVVPGATTQLIMGTCSAGTANQIIATQNPNTLVSNLGYGPLVEAAALVCLAGGTVLAVKVPTVTAGGFQSGGVQFSGTGTSIITATGAPYDTYFVKFLVTTSGTIGSPGIMFQISLDAGRNYGSILALGSASTYVIPNTGITLNFAAGNLVKGDTAQVGTTEPLWNDAGVEAALQAFQASPYAIGGVGSMFLVGTAAGTDTSTIDTNGMTPLANGYVYNRLIENCRDVLCPVAYGGTGETEAVWMTSIETAYSSVSAERACVSAGFYNMPSAFRNPAAGSPAYRRPLSWTLACREVTIPPQRHAGRVKDGPLAQIVINPVSDPTDGFVYHDERLNPGLDAARFNSAWTRVGLPGFYDVNPNLMSPLASSFPILPLGNVMDVACDIVHQIGQTEIDSDIRLNSNGTIYENDARAIEAVFSAALQANMLSTNMISGFTVSVDRTNNIQLTSTVNVTVTIVPRGYIEEVSATIGFLTTGQATP